MVDLQRPFKMEEFKIHVEKMCQHYNELTASYSAPTTNDLEYYHYTTLNYYKDLDEMLLPLHSLYMNYLLLAVLEPAHHNDLIHLINDFIRHVPEFRKYSTFKTYHHLFIAQDSVPLHAIERITGLIGMIKMQDDKSGPHQASNHAAIRAMEERITKMSTEKDKELETSICYTFREHFILVRDFSLTPFDDVANKDFFEIMQNDRTYKTLLYRVKHAQVVMDNAKDELAVARRDLQRERRHPMIHGPKKEILAKMSRQLDDLADHLDPETMANFLKEESARMKLKAEKFARRSKIMKKAATMRQDRARQTVASLRPRAQLRVDLP